MKLAKEREDREQNQNCQQAVAVVAGIFNVMFACI